MIQEHTELEDFLAKEATASAVNGATLYDLSGSILAGATNVQLAPPISLNGYKHLAITVKNKPGSVSAMTFTFQETNQGITGGSNTVTLASLREGVGSIGYSYVSTALAGISTSLVIKGSADPGSGEDNYHITVTGYTS